LRAAVEEAKVEIAAYRAEREARYAAMVNEQTGNKAEMDDRLKAEFDVEMSALHARINASKMGVVQDLVAAVTNL
jgi:V-type H+-transporting ATPase subunit G